jgi:hypothetical protein
MSNNTKSLVVEILPSIQTIVRSPASGLSGAVRIWVQELMNPLNEQVSYKN